MDDRNSIENCRIRDKRLISSRHLEEAENLNAVHV